MNKRLFALIIMALGVMLILVACGQSASETPAAATLSVTKAPVVTKPPVDTPVQPALSGDSIRGGKLYDNWINELGAEAPKTVNPQWVAAKVGDSTVPSSYRCVKCHGWDYKGVKSFSGIAASAGKDPNEILAVLKGSKNKDHDYSALMDDQSLSDLALYISEQQIDTAVVLALTGDADNGKKLYTENCVECHGPDSVAINFHPDNAPEYPATIANKDQLSLLGKLRFGQPSVDDMPSGVDLGFTSQDYMDMIALLKSLPTASPITEGGRMYDEWFAAIGKDAPEGDQPLWKTQTTNTRTGAVTWRCKECHGWDYKGVDGVYGSGSHKTGFKGILDAAKMTPADLTAWLDGTKNKDHNFSSSLTKDDFARMIAFVQKDVFDKSSIINADKTVIGGNNAHGKQLFESSCKSCHGEDGKTLNFGDDKEPEYFGTIAADNPWEFFNKASVGVPGEPMPAGWNLGWKQQDILDLMTYAQTLPTK